MSTLKRSVEDAKAEAGLLIAFGILAFATICLLLLVMPTAKSAVLTAVICAILAIVCSYKEALRYEYLAVKAFATFLTIAFLLWGIEVGDVGGRLFGAQIIAAAAIQLPFTAWFYSKKSVKDHANQAIFYKFFIAIRGWLSRNGVFLILAAIIFMACRLGGNMLKETILHYGITFFIIMVFNEIIQNKFQERWKDIRYEELPLWSNREVIRYALLFWFSHPGYRASSSLEL